jgi:hypothetical protein
VIQVAEVIPGKRRSPSSKLTVCRRPAEVGRDVNESNLAAERTSERVDHRLVCGNIGHACLSFQELVG